MIRHFAMLLFGLSLIVLVGCGGETDKIVTLPASIPAVVKPPAMGRPGGPARGPDAPDAAN
jgi:hypothetical protein